MTRQINTLGRGSLTSMIAVLFVSMVFLVLIEVARAGPFAGAGGPIEIELGKPHPDFVLPLLEGKKATLSDFYGKKLLLIHFASW